MAKEVSVKIDNRYVVILEDKWVSFSDTLHEDCVSLPIEVFYQMWDSSEMCNHMEVYHLTREHDND